MPEKTINLKKSVMQKDWVLFFEYTDTGTPQQNAYVKRAFPMIMGQA